jgi:hypothetical protein
MLLKAAQLSFQDPLLDVDDVEAMCASLLDQVGLNSEYAVYYARLRS